MLVYMKNLDPRLFKPSGLNSQFKGADLSFDEYIHQTQAMLRAARVDLDPQNAADIINANSPFEWQPPNFDGRRGILLIHGLLDSPFMVRDLAQHFLRRGFLVRSILLPGHGSVPGDLIGIHHQEWVKAVDYGVESFKHQVQQIFLGGFSLGGALAVYKAQRDPNLAGLILLAPALALPQQYLAWLLHFYSLLGRYVPAANWYQRRPQVDYTKYVSFAIDGIFNTYRIAEEVREAGKKKSLTMPLFVAQCAIDEVVSAQEIVEFFSHTPNSLNRMLFYSANNTPFNDSRILHRSSVYLEENILDFSHLALPIAPENPHYGAHGDYRDFLLYPDQQPPPGKVCLGPRNKTLLKQHIIQRLTFNPDFAGMTRAIDQFLKVIN